MVFHSHGRNFHRSFALILVGFNESAVHRHEFATGTERYYIAHRCGGEKDISRALELTYSLCRAGKGFLRCTIGFCRHLSSQYTIILTCRSSIEALDKLALRRLHRSCLPLHGSNFSCEYGWVHCKCS